MHDDATINPMSTKPDIILHCNATKGGVDTVNAAYKHRREFLKVLALALMKPHLSETCQHGIIA